MKIFKMYYLLGLCFLSTLTAFSQSKVTGTVIDGDLNQPLAGANVVVKGTSTGTVTDFDGKFEISTTEKIRSNRCVLFRICNKTISFTVTGNSVNLGNIVVALMQANLKKLL